MFIGMFIALYIFLGVQNLKKVKFQTYSFFIWLKGSIASSKVCSKNKVKQHWTSTNCAKLFISDLALKLITRCFS